MHLETLKHKHAHTRHTLTCSCVRLCRHSFTNRHMYEYTWAHTNTRCTVCTHAHVHTDAGLWELQHAPWPRVLYARWALQFSDQWPSWAELPSLTQASCFLQSGHSGGLWVRRQTPPVRSY